MIATELQRHSWLQLHWSSDKFTASSPFRSGDSNASFYVWLEDNPRFNARAGDWGDSGAVDPEWRRGDFTKLIAFLRRETYEEAAEYLRYTYNTEWTTEEEITLSIPQLAVESPNKYLDVDLLKLFAHSHNYLERRGISESVQRFYRVGYDRTRQAVTIPWFDASGRLCNILFRSVNSKVFWYQRGGMPIRTLLFGIDKIYSRNVKHAALVEAPIDALFLASCGIPTLAVGGTAFNEEKRDLIVRSPIEEITIFNDNDDAGREMRDIATEMLHPYVTVRHVVYPNKEVKDPAEIGDQLTVCSIFSNATNYSNKLQLSL